MIVLISEQGREVAERVASYLRVQGLYSEADGSEERSQVEIIGRGEVAARWKSLDCLVFVGAMGICVRTIAPLLKDKHTDPAVLCVSSNGKEVVSVLSGHIGGANEITTRLATHLKAHPVITTQTDGCGLWALDLLAQRFGWTQECDDLNSQIFLYAGGKPTALLIEVHDDGTKWLEENPAGNVEFFYRFEDIDLSKFSLLLSVSPIRRRMDIPTIQWVPKCLHLGIGLARQAGPTEKVIEDIFNCLSNNGICREAIVSISSADIKKDEPVLKALERELKTHNTGDSKMRNTMGYKAYNIGDSGICNAGATEPCEAEPCKAESCDADNICNSSSGLFSNLGSHNSRTTNDVKVMFYSAEQLSSVPVPTPSETVEKCVGTPSVSEASAILSALGCFNTSSSSCGKSVSSSSGNSALSSSGGNSAAVDYRLFPAGCLVLPKQKGTNWTLAAAVDYSFLPHPHIEIVGAGPGDPELVSVRGMKMLRRADLILYAGSLVPKELTFYAKPSATVVSSAAMDLEQQCALMKDFYDKGKFIVRLHTGDPCIFGAIQEQMAFFDKHRMNYHITPGISSFLAAAAELKSQFTIPEKCQTIILTRGEGRTPMPDKEKLHLLAKSNSTMCIFLSAAIVEQVQQELLMEYPEDTPVAACYHLTWPDQRIYRGVLKDLSKIVKDNNLTLTTMLVVGAAIDNREGLSELYSKHFTHLFRKAEKDEGSE